jgi:hypothetical protein
VKPLRAAPVVLEDDRLVVRDLAVDGAALVAAREAVAHGRDLELTVRQMLETGGAVLLHGSGKGTVDAVGAEVDRLLTALSERSGRIEAVRGLQQRIAAKGFAFEELLAPVLDACFAPHQDVVSVTSASTGIADDKVGDFCVTVNPRDTGGRDRRIVIEAKDRKLSMDKSLAELDAAMLNRDAQVGVLIFAKAAQAPLAGKPLRVLHGNRIVLVYDKDEQSPLALEVGCQLARTLAIAAEREDLTLDRGMLTERLAKLVNAIERAGAIQRGIRSARRGLDAAEDAYREMSEETLALLYELEDRLGD